MRRSLSVLWRRLRRGIPKTIQRHHEIDVADNLTVSEAIGANLSVGDDVVGVRVGDSQGRNVAADVRPDGMVTLNLEGTSRQGEHGVDLVCRLLMARLNEAGATWQGIRDVSRASASTESGVDCELYDGPRRLRIQVVRAEGSQSLWRALKHLGRIEGLYGADEMADTIRKTIDRKVRRTPVAVRRDVLLALDSIDTASHALPPAMRSFRAKHGAWVDTLGYYAVWLVGPNTALISRLDRELTHGVPPQGMPPN